MAERSVWVAFGTHRNRQGRRCTLPAEGREVQEWLRHGEAVCPQCDGILPRENRKRKLIGFSKEELKDLACEEKRILIRDSHKWPRCSHGNILGSCHEC